jgi:hypothetical protein
MSKINVNRRGPTADAGLTLESLRPGETFRFPRSTTGVVYQLLTVSNSMQKRSLRSNWEFIFVNVSNGRVFGTDDPRSVVLVDCSLTARERTPSTSTSRRRTRKLARRRSR